MKTYRVYLPSHILKIRADKYTTTENTIEFHRQVKTAYKKIACVYKFPGIAVVEN